MKKAIMYRVGNSLFDNFEEANKQEAIDKATKEFYELMRGKVTDNLWIPPFLENASEVINILERYLVNLNRKEEK